MTQAGCRGPELVALFSHRPCRVHAAALSHQGVAQPAWRHPRHTHSHMHRQPCTDSQDMETWGSGACLVWHCPLRLFSGVLQTFLKSSLVTTGPAPLGLPPAEVWRSCMSVVPADTVRDPEGHWPFPAAQQMPLEGHCVLPSKTSQCTLTATLRAGNSLPFYK